jgi:hypothetical protein
LVSSKSLLFYRPEKWSSCKHDNNEILSNTSYSRNNISPTYAISLNSEDNNTPIVANQNAAHYSRNSNTKNYCGTILNNSAADIDNKTTAPSSPLHHFFY